ncbi:hypothetical protein, partial [Pseudomonas sp. A-R-19]|uniref:hypothetical protein n=1 Tax=Pseudomonas sp. A-R-19 TaxID=2832403 RepID=UPI001CC10D96
HHFHADHPVFSCSKIEQKQLNTWVSFQSAEQPLLGQFSVSGNKVGSSSHSGSCRLAQGRRMSCCGTSAMTQPKTAQAVHKLNVGLMFFVCSFYQV